MTITTVRVPVPEIANALANLARFTGKDEEYRDISFTRGPYAHVSGAYATDGITAARVTIIAKWEGDAQTFSIPPEMVAQIVNEGKLSTNLHRSELKAKRATPSFIIQVDEAAREVSWYSEELGKSRISKGFPMSAYKDPNEIEAIFPKEYARRAETVHVDPKILANVLRVKDLRPYPSRRNDLRIAEVHSEALRKYIVAVNIGTWFSAAIAPLNGMANRYNHLTPCTWEADWMLDLPEFSSKP